jgi:hypothetical protein
MPIGLIGIAAFVLYIYLVTKFHLARKHGALIYFIGFPIFIILVIILLKLIGVPIDSSDDGECVKWNWSTGECAKKMPFY